MSLNKTDEPSTKKQKMVDIEKLKWAYTNNCLNSEMIWSKAIEEANFEILEWVKTERIPWVKPHFDVICQNDNVDLLKWIHNNNEISLYNIYNKNIFFEHVGEYGAFNILLWLNNNNTLSSHEIETIVCKAAKCGKKNIVEWCFLNYTIRDHVQKQICNNAISSDNFELVKYLFENNCPFDKDRVMYYASSSKNLELIKYVYAKNSFYWYNVYYSSGLQNIIDNFKNNYNCDGFIKIVNWAIESHCPSNGFECLLASKKNDIELLKFLVLKNLPNHSMVGLNLSGFAAFYGEFELLKWLKENLSEAQSLYEFNENTTLMAAQGLQTYILSWLIKEGCKYNKRECINAIRNNSETTKTSIGVDYKPVFVIDNIESFSISTD